MKSKLVLFIVQDMPSPLDRRVWLEATSLQKAGYRICILCPNSKDFKKYYERLSEIQIFRFPKIIEGRNLIGLILEYFFDVFFLTAFQFGLAIFKPISLIHICNPPDFLFITTMGVRLLRKPKIVYDQHDLVPELWLTKNFSNSKLVFNVLQRLESYTQKKSNALIFASSSFRDKYRKKAFAVNSTKPNIIIKTAPRKSFGIESGTRTTPSNILKHSEVNEIHFAYIGRMGKQDGVEILIKAFSIIHRKHKHLQIYLDLVGDGPESASLKELAKTLRCNQNVIFHGYISDDGLLRTILSRSILGICPDLPNPMNNLLSMNKITEYMALSLPIVQFNLLENRKTAENCSIIVDLPTPEGLANGIEELLFNSKLQKQLSVNARLNFENQLSWEHQESRLIKFYSAL